MIYLDNAATSRPSATAIKAANEMFEKLYGNPSSLHKAGHDAEKAVEQARRFIAEAISAQPEEILFTSGGTEANNLAIIGAARAHKRSGNRIITSDSEHPSVLRCFKALEDEGFEVVYIPTVEGTINMEKLANAVDDNTILISIMLVNNETGAINPVHLIRGVCRSKKVSPIIHADAVQATGKLSYSVSALNVDLLSMSAHKFHGIKGAGALYIKKGINLLPVMYGGGQEKGLRSGTENTPAIAAMGAAIHEIMPSIKERYKRVSELRKYITDRLKDLNIIVNSPDNGLPYILNISLPGLKSETVLHFLESKDIYVSTTSACSSRKGAESYVLKAMGLSKERIESAVRVSFSDDTTLEEADILIETLKECIKELKSKSN
ncbi:MAG: cysteine desulfurase family protein [Bacillota bacterium]|nr:cysteine desulfurase family protein [Bacillota bacterium]